MNVPESFIDLIYSPDNKEDYIGMGNPYAKILIIGKEPAHDLSNKDDVIKNKAVLCNKRDQELNKENWKNLIEDKALQGVYLEERLQICNPRRPFPNQRCIINRSSHGTAETWLNYQKLVDMILGREYEMPYSLRPVDFHDFCFHTDISAAGAKNQYKVDKEAKVKSIEERRKLFSHPFFRQFPIVILAVGNDITEYNLLNWSDDVLKFPRSEVKMIQKKPKIWLNNDSKGYRCLVDIRALSQMKIKREDVYKYFDRIREVVWENGRRRNETWPEMY